VGGADGIHRWLAWGLFAFCFDSPKICSDSAGADEIGAWGSSAAAVEFRFFHSRGCSRFAFGSCSDNAPSFPSGHSVCTPASSTAGSARRIASPFYRASARPRCNTTAKRLSWLANSGSQDNSRSFSPFAILPVTVREPEPAGVRNRAKPSAVPLAHAPRVTQTDRATHPRTIPLPAEITAMACARTLKPEGKRP
jgi:hypothetical protein